MCHRTSGLQPLVVVVVVVDNILMWRRHDDATTPMMGTGYWPQRSGELLTELT